jgi:hypothetical protein
MKNEFRNRLLSGFIVGFISVHFIREFLENMFGLAGVSTALRALAIGIGILVLTALVQEWKLHHLLGSLGTALLGAMSSLLVLFSQFSA